jgi:osmotically-inducible protein OsmY
MNKLTQISMACLFGLSALTMAGCVNSTPKQESTGQYLDNSVITANVKAGLLSDPYVKSFPITVNTYKGVVQLSGFVHSRAQANRAERIAGNVPGVRSVENDLIIK